MMRQNINNTDLSEIVLDDESSLLMFNGLINEYKCTKEIDVLNEIETLLKTFSSKEKLRFHEMIRGQVYCFLYSINHEEMYLDLLNKDVSKLYEIVKSQTLNMKDLFYIMPFYLEYETNFNSKENYTEIIEIFKMIREKHYDVNDKIYYRDKKLKTFEIHDYALFLMSLSMSLNIMSKEIFEQYRNLELLFKEAVSLVCEVILNTTDLVLDEHDENYTDKLMILYAILLSCINKVISVEKYQDKCLVLLNSKINKMISNDDYSNKKAKSNNYRLLGINMMIKTLILELNIVVVKEG